MTMSSPQDVKLSRAVQYNIFRVYVVFCTCIRINVQLVPLRSKQLLCRNYHREFPSVPPTVRVLALALGGKEKFERPPGRSRDVRSSSDGLGMKFEFEEVGRKL